MDSNLCTYCANLEVLDRDRHGTRSRCPLCKSEMLRTDAGATYRIPTDADGIAPTGNRRRMPVLVPAIAAVCLAAIGVWVAASPRQKQPTHREITTAPPPSEPFMIARAVFKSGHADTFVGLAKPTARPPESLGKPFASPRVEPVVEPELLPLPVRIMRADFWTSPHHSADSLLAQVGNFPEVSLGGHDEPYDRAAVFKLNTALATSDLNSGGPLVDHIKKRSDIAGLPFLFDKSQLNPKAAKSLAIHSAEITRLLDGRFNPERRTSRGPIQPAQSDPNSSEAEKVAVFWAHYGFERRNDAESLPEGTNALEQVLMAKSPEFRKSLIAVMENASGPASQILVRRALFDLDPAVRRDAVAALERRNEHEYTNLLIEGFRYPWPPVARHAAEALIALNRTDLVDSLRAMLDERDPYSATVKGTPVAREAIRLNHFKNCLLCHAPLSSGNAQQLLAAALTVKATVPVGVVPIPGEEIPKSYNDEMRARIFVRADVTYLRQDFSVRLDVAKMDPWPVSQRFDVLVRTRPLTDEETIRWYNLTLRTSPNGPSLQFAIERLQRLQPPPEALPAPVVSTFNAHYPQSPSPTPVSPASPSTDSPWLAKLAQDVPELALWKEKMDSDKLTKLSRSIYSKNEKKEDAFIAELRSRRSDLSGLPFAMGANCRIGSAAARALATNSLALNLARGRDAFGVRAFWTRYESFWSSDQTDVQRSPSDKIEAVPAVEQVTAGMSPLFRAKLIEVASESPDAAKVYVRRALYDFDPEVRRLAIFSLKKHNNAETANLLMNGFRYPWPPVAQHAAEALVALKRTDIVETLEKMRHERDPYFADGDDAAQPKVRELVRVNHLKNCFLCHPPLTRAGGLQFLADAGPKSDLPFGVVPIPGQEIPVRYYNSSTAEIFVRADATYLRQDFSATLDVKDADPWPKAQRFDFLVRTRPQTAAEIADGRRPTTLECSANGPALSAAIERLKQEQAAASSESRAR